MIDYVYRYSSPIRVDCCLVSFTFALLSNMIRFRVVQLLYCVVFGPGIHVQFIANIDCTSM
jgi:hypothetical protein